MGPMRVWATTPETSGTEDSLVHEAVTWGMEWLAYSTITEAMIAVARGDHVRI